MTISKPGLGKGLDALLATSSQAVKVSSQEPPSQTPSDNPLHYLPLNHLLQGQYQPRKTMPAAGLDELANSIRTQGVIQPLVVRPLYDDKYEIVAGERRYEAAKIAGLTHVPCLIKPLDDKASAAIALIENIQREDLNVMEEAEALQRLLSEFSLTHQQTASLLGKSRSSVSNLVRLNTLSPQVKQWALEGKLEMGHARALLALESEPQISAAQRVITKQLTVRQTEALVKKTLALTPDKPATSAFPSPFFNEIQTRLSERFDTKVNLVQGKGESGKLVISFDKKEKLMQLLSLLGEKI